VALAGTSGVQVDAHAHSGQRATAQAGSDPDTTVTFAVTSGALTMTAPSAANLGSGAPGSTISGALGSVSVSDNRALLSASWTVTASASNFTTGTGTPAETIPAGDVSYAPGVTGSSGSGDNSASWDPTISVAVPVAAVNGTYTGVISHSVS
jgi:hypothetical protein